MIINKRTSDIVSDSEEHANSILSQILGLMFRISIKKPLIFKIKNNNRCGEVHMCCVFFDIDIAFLDENDIIIYVGNLEKWNGIKTFDNKVKTIIEFPINTIIDNDLKIGDELVFL